MLNAGTAIVMDRYEMDRAAADRLIDRLSARMRVDRIEVARAFVRASEDRQ